MNLKKVHLFGLDVLDISLPETVEYINASIRKGMVLLREDLNAYKVVMMKENAAFYDTLRRSDFINADGFSILLASKLLGRPIQKRVTGIDLMEALIAGAANNNFRVFFFGAQEEVVTKVVEHYKSLFGENIIAGYRNGYYKEEESDQIAQQIAASQAHMLFVAINSPKKEFFLDKYKNKLNTSFLMGVGGSFDVIAGKVDRAPVWMQRNGLEWLYRFYQEPLKMWRRYTLGNLKFLGSLVREFFSKTSR